MWKHRAAWAVHKIDQRTTANWTKKFETFGKSYVVKAALDEKIAWELYVSGKNMSMNYSH